MFQDPALATSNARLASTSKRAQKTTAWAVVCLSRDACTCCIEADAWEKSGARPDRGLPGRVEALYATVTEASARGNRKTRLKWLIEKTTTSGRSKANTLQVLHHHMVNHAHAGAWAKPEPGESLKMWSVDCGFSRHVHFRVGWKTSVVLTIVPTRKSKNVVCNASMQSWSQPWAHVARVQRSPWRCRQSSVEVHAYIYIHTHICMRCGVIIWSKFIWCFIS